MTEQVMQEVQNEEMDPKIIELTEQLKVITNERDQYRAAYEQTNEKFNRLFGLFANNIDYYLGNIKSNQ